MILAFDIGTSAVKGGVIDNEGKLLFLKRIETAFSPSSWIEAVRQVCREAGSHSIEALAISGNGPTIVAVDREGEPLGAPVSWMTEVRQECLEEVNSRISDPVIPGFFLGRIYQFCKDYPDLYEKTAYFLSCPEYICYYFTHNPVTLLYSEETHRFTWTLRSIDELGLDRDKFPPFGTLGEVSGVLSPGRAEEFNLPPGLPVISCGTDFFMSILGTGAVNPGQVCDRAGTSEGVNLCWDAPVQDEVLLVMPHIVDGLFNVSGVLASSGKNIEWLKQQFEIKSTSEVFNGLKGEAPADLFYLPFIQENRTSLWGKVRGGFYGLTAGHTREDLFRAVLESTAFAVRGLLDRMGGHNLELKEIRVTGRPSTNPFWLNLRSRMSTLPIKVPRIIDSELTGAASVGFKALGRYRSIREAANNTVMIDRVLKPEPTPGFEEKYEKFNELVSRLKGFF